MFPVRYELDFYILFRRNSVFKGLSLKPIKHTRYTNILLDIAHCLTYTQHFGNWTLFRHMIYRIKTSDKTSSTKKKKRRYLPFDCHLFSSRLVGPRLDAPLLTLRKRARVRWGCIGKYESGVLALISPWLSILQFYSLFFYLFHFLFSLCFWWLSMHHHEGKFIVLQCTSYIPQTMGIIFVHTNSLSWACRFEIQMLHLGFDLWTLDSTLTIYSQVVTICTTLFNTLNLRVLPTQCICVFRKVVTINSDCFPKQN
jgi:hypothetical protein